VDEQGKPQFIIWAKEASYQGGKWIFKEGLYKRQEENFVPRWFQKETLSLEFSPDTVLVVKRIPRTQHLKELWTQRSFLKKAGLSTRAPDGEMAYRLFYPLAAPGLLAIALPVLLGERGRHALGKGLSLGLLSIFLGLAGFMALKGIADTGHLSPLVALPGGVLGLVLVGGFLFWWRRF
jgi:lipopolysaccharide export system permease protein